jgi:hypothetical protein
MRKVEFKGPHGRALSYKVLQKYENMSHNIVSFLSQRNKIFSTQISQELLNYIRTRKLQKPVS